MESLKRSIAKAVSWRLWATSETILISYLLTGSFKLAAAIGAVDTTVKIFTYFIHERFWNRIKYGRESQPDYQI
jgi:uncharacterized membrane protein